MSEYESIRADRTEEDYRTLLMQLPGVFAAGVRMDADNNPQEIHILGSSERNPKQVVRDVQSALYAAFGMDVDHRIISVAQLSGNPIAPQTDVPKEMVVSAAPEPHRLRCKAVSHQIDEEGYTIRVVLHYDGQDYEGVDYSPPSPVQRLMATVQATINAIHAFFSVTHLYHPVVVQCVQIGGIPVVVAVVELMEEHGPCFLVGSSKQTEDGVVGVVRATLDALNRSIGKLWPTR